MSKETIKALLAIGIQLLGKLIPFLGTFLGGPFGVIAGALISYLSGVLYDWIEQMSRFAEIDANAKKDLDAAKAASDALSDVQTNPLATKEEHEKALAEFAARVARLGKFRL